MSADADGGFHGADEDFAIADFPGFGSLDDGIDGGLHAVFSDDELNFNFGEEVHGVFAAAIDFGVTFLATKSLDFGDRHAFESDFVQGVFDVLKFEWLDDCFYFFHVFVVEVNVYCLPVEQADRNGVKLKPCQMKKILHFPKFPSESARFCDEGARGLGCNFLPSRLYSRLLEKICMDLAISIRSLSKTYRNGVKALRGLSMDVGRGEVFGLLGPNGAGKSTLVKILLTLVRPTQCDGQMLGQAIGHRETLRRVGYLPEHVQYSEHLTPIELLDLSGRLTGVKQPVREKRIKELLAAVGMDRWKKDRLATFSKGMKQRVGLAQALMNDPEIVFLDEPTDGVDPLGRKDIRELIMTLRSRGKTIFVNSHLLGELELICDRVAILCQGKVLRQGKLAELTRYGSRYEVLAEGDLFDQEGLLTVVKTLGGTVALTPERGQTVISVPTSRPQVIQPVIDELRRLGRVIESVTPARQTLEELFVDVVLTGGSRPADLSQPEAQFSTEG